MGLQIMLTKFKLVQCWQKNDRILAGVVYNGYIRNTCFMSWAS